MKRFFLMIILLTNGLSADASTIQLAPVTLLFSPTQQMTTLNIKNMDKTSSTWQLSLKAWSEKSGQMSYQSTDDFLMMPLIFSLNPSQNQLIRLARKKVTTSSVEQSYRLFVEEISQPDKTVNTEGKSGINILLDVSIPIFIEPEKIMKQYSISVKRQSNNNATVILKNTGNIHLLLLGYDIYDINHKQCYTQKNSLVYILVGNTWNETIHFSKPCLGDELFIKPNIEM